MPAGTMFPQLSRLSHEMAETPSHTSSNVHGAKTDIRLIATLLTPLAMAGAVIVALRESS
jgi:hypothetical protein